MTLKNSNKVWLLALPLLLILCGGCGIYSFSGSTLPPDVQTISIQNFENSTGEGPANLTQLVTNNFKIFYQRNSNLNIVQRDGDLQLEGQIVSFTYTPAAIQREGVNDIAGLNRLTLGIQVRFTNAKNPEKSFDRLFSISQDFQQGRDVTQISPSEIDALTERLVVDVFNKTVADW
ncbi:LptE family protein [Pontibacter cellulosilyticus]|uniref:LptE family protein n=1 Tax=Pontibacter cellulosilyticus TaxID=1720253 RepID=A0A923N2F9_9BACT|nr:LptE family protein [Pontibacter cellulosilyticus]MBC5991650.1 LptE family protein [Pontibacter cellulosilyticus]